MRASPLSVSELNEYVRRSLAGDPMLQGIAIQGEISNFKRHTSGHLYFTLKDESSRISCVMFRQYAQMLRFQPTDGMHVHLAGSVGLYTASGTYQFYGEAMAQAGAGALYELYLKTKDRLQHEGLFDASLKKPLPLLPKGIGIVTAKGGAVLHDIQTITQRRFPGMPMFLRAAQVQGAGAAEDLVNALAEIAQLDQVDVIIIGRGGGSLEDLWAFNEEVLVRAVHQCKKPVISAVGHETDVSLTDYAADVRAATPSAAAELAVPLKADLLQRLNSLESQLYSEALQNLADKKDQISQFDAALQLNDPAHRLSIVGIRIAHAREKLLSNAEKHLKAFISRFESANERLEISSPRHTLRRGYAMALVQGKPITSVNQVGDEFQVRFLDGIAKVKSLEITQEHFK